MRRFAAIVLTLVLHSGACVSVLADETVTTSSPAPNDGTCDYNSMLAAHESGGGGGGGYGVVNSYGYLGKYQFGNLALIDLEYKDRAGNWTGKDGVYSQADFLANPATQEAAITEWNALLDRRTAHLQKYIGMTVPGCGATVTQAGLRAGAHLRGVGGLQSYLESGGVCSKTAGNGLKYPTMDAYGTCVGKYLCNMSGCQSISTDMSKKTCDVTMPMIEGINCSNYTGELQSFCQQAQPYLMTRDECTSAESWAERAPKGPNEEACKNLSFGPGTGSWSFVLACSYAQQVVADQDGVANPSGPVSDPACIERLRGMGVEFDSLGQTQNGSYGGTTCMIENAVSLWGTAVPFGAKLNMTCDMAIAMEQFGQRMSGLGVTSYYGIGSTRTCGPMRDKNGNKPGTITEHALGRAVDISGFVIGGRKVSFGAIHQPATPDGALASTAKALACSTFRGVLSPTYAGYVGAYVHFHVEWGAFQGCR